MLFSRIRHGGMACINSKISEGVLYKDMVYNKIFKKETFEIFFQYCITRQKWAGMRRPLARGPYHKGPFLKYLWLKDLQNQRTFGQRIFAPKDLFQKDLLSKGPFGKRTFCPKDLLVLSLKSKY